MVGSESPVPATPPDAPSGAVAAAGAAPAGAPPAAARPSSSALLAADVGTVYTKVYLLDDVGGERRLVAVGRAPSAGSDGTPAPAQALAGALAQALQRAGRSEHPAPAERVLLTSAGTVPRLAIVAPGPAEARTVAGALESLPARVLEPLTLDGPARDPETLLGQLEAQAPDAIVVLGGRPGQIALAGAAVEAIARGFGRQAPLVLLAGDAEFAARAASFQEGGPYLVAEGDPGGAVRELAGRFVKERLAGAWAGEADLNGWAAGGARSSLEGVCAATQLIADRYDVDVLTLDVGAAHAMAVACLGQAGQRRTLAVTRDDLGLRLGRQTILREAGAEAMAAWLPVDVEEAALRQDARQGVAVPAALPETVEDLLLEHAFAREALRLLLEDMARRYAAGAGRPDGPLALPAVDLVIGSGGALAGVPRLTQAALILLDAVQPDALTQLAVARSSATGC